MSNRTSTPTVSVTIPEIADPNEVFNQQITTLEAQRDALAPAVEAFNTLEGMIARLVAARDGKTVTAGNGNRAGRGDRPEQFLELLREAGDKGVIIAQAARDMGMSGPNYLYRIVPELIEAGLVRKDDDSKRYFIAATATEDAPEGDVTPEGDESGDDTQE